MKSDAKSIQPQYHNKQQSESDGSTSTTSFYPIPQATSSGSMFVEHLFRKGFADANSVAVYGR
jgi:hypothetical protein